MPGTYYKAAWENSLIVSTLIISAVVILCAYWPFQMARSPGIGMKILGSLLLTIMLGIIVFSYLLSPKGYLIRPDSLTIVRPIKSLMIPLARIISVEEAPATVLTDSTRLLGCDGLWGQYGKYQNDKLGIYRLYVRNTGGLVIIRGQDTYVIAPERPQEFIHTLKQELPAGADKGVLK